MVTVSGATLTVDLGTLLSALGGQLVAFLVFAYRIDRKIRDLTIKLETKGCLSTPGRDCNDD